MELNESHNLKQVINGRVLEFIAMTHTYLVDGNEVPSVSQVISKVLPSLYKTVDPIVLANAANRGISLHKEIELYETCDIIGNTQEFKNYIKLKNIHQFKIIDSEKLILIEIGNQVLCAGRLDMIIESKNEQGLGLADIKRTYALYLEHLKLQLNLYKIGYEQSYHQKINYLKCLHLRQNTYDYIQIPIDEDYAIKKLGEYYTLI